MENDSKDKKEEVLGEVVTPEPNPGETSENGIKDNKPEDRGEKPENKGEDKSGKNKENVYDKYRYWGSEPPKNGSGPSPKGGMRNKFALIALLFLLV